MQYFFLTKKSRLHKIQNRSCFLPTISKWNSKFWFTVKSLQHMFPMYLYSECLLLTHSYSISKYYVEFSENIVGFWTLHFLKKRKEIAVKVQNEKVRSDTEGFLFCSAIRNPVWWSRDHEDKALFCKLGQVTLLKTLVFDPHPPCNRANMFLNLQF